MPKGFPIERTGDMQIRLSFATRRAMPQYRWVRWSTIVLAEVSSVQTASRRGRLPTAESARVTLLVVVPSRSWAAPNVWILGGYQSDFARNLTREGLDFADLTAEVVDTTLDRGQGRRRRHRRGPRRPTPSASCSPGRATSARCRPRVNDGLWDTPASRHEAACASGSVATLAAIADLRSGAYRHGAGRRRRTGEDRARRHRRRSTSARPPGSATRAPTPSSCGRTCSTSVADEYDRRYGLDDDPPARHRPAELRQRPPQPQRADPRLDGARPASADDDDEPTRSIEGRLRRFDCSQMTDGGAGIVLVTDDYLRDHPDARPIGRIDGWGHRTVGLGLQQKLDRAADDPYVLPHVRRAVLDAFDRAHVTLDDVDGFEVHDCFTPSEYLAIDHIGLTGPGRIVEGHRERRDRDRRTAADQPQRRADRRRPPGRRLRRADAARRRQAGQRHGRRLPGRGRKDVRHAQLRRQHRHHRQLRRRAESEMSRRQTPEVVGKFLSTLPEDDDHPYRTGPWRPQTTEWDADDLDRRRGRDPARPRRRLPAQHREPAAPGAEVLPPVRRRRHGARRRLPRRKGVLPQPVRPHRRIRWPRTRPAARCGRASPNRCRLAKRDDGWGARTLMKDASSTDVVVHRGTALTSFYQCGDLYRLDPYSAETLGKADWNGALPVRLGRVGAPEGRRRAPASCCSSTTARRRRTCTTASSTPNDDLVHYVDVPLPGPRLPHDMAFTENYAILNDFPLFWDPELLAGRRPPAAASTPTCRRGSPSSRAAADTDDIRWFEADPTYVLHFTNAYEDGDEIVLDGFFQGDPEPVDNGDGRQVAAGISGSSPWTGMQTRLHRWRFNLVTGATHARSSCPTASPSSA